MSFQDELNAITNAGQSASVETKNTINNSYARGSVNAVVFSEEMATSVGVNVNDTNTYPTTKTDFYNNLKYFKPGARVLVVTPKAIAGVYDVTASGWVKDRAYDEPMEMSGVVTVIVSGNDTGVGKDLLNNLSSYMLRKDADGVYVLVQNRPLSPIQGEFQTGLGYPRYNSTYTSTSKYIASFYVPGTRMDVNTGNAEYLRAGSNGAPIKPGYGGLTLSYSKDTTSSNLNGVFFTLNADYADPDIGWSSTRYRLPGDFANTGSWVADRRVVTIADGLFHGGRLTSLVDILSVKMDMSGAKATTLGLNNFTLGGFHEYPKSVIDLLNANTAGSPAWTQAVAIGHPTVDSNGTPVLEYGMLEVQLTPWNIADNPSLDKYYIRQIYTTVTNKRYERIGTVVGAAFIHTLMSPWTSNAGSYQWTVWKNTQTIDWANISNRPTDLSGLGVDQAKLIVATAKTTSGDAAALPANSITAISKDDAPGITNMPTHDLFQYPQIASQNDVTTLNFRGIGQTPTTSIMVDAQTGLTFINRHPTVSGDTTVWQGLAPLKGTMVFKGSIPQSGLTTDMLKSTGFWTGVLDPAVVGLYGTMPGRPASAPHPAMVTSKAPNLTQNPLGYEMLGSYSNMSVMEVDYPNNLVLGDTYTSLFKPRHYKATFLISPAGVPTISGAWSYWPTPAAMVTTQTYGIGTLNATSVIDFNDANYFRSGVYPMYRQQSTLTIDTTKFTYANGPIIESNRAAVYGNRIGLNGFLRVTEMWGHEFANTDGLHIVRQEFVDDGDMMTTYVRLLLVDQAYVLVSVYKNWFSTQSNIRSGNMGILSGTFPAALDTGVYTLTLDTSATASIPFGDVLVAAGGAYSLADYTTGNLVDASTYNPVSMIGLLYVDKSSGHRIGLTGMDAKPGLRLATMYLNNHIYETFTNVNNTTNANQSYNTTQWRYRGLFSNNYNSTRPGTFQYTIPSLAAATDAAMVPVYVRPVTTLNGCAKITISTTPYSGNLAGGFSYKAGYGNSTGYPQFRLELEITGMTMTGVAADFAIKRYMSSNGLMVSNLEYPIKGYTDASMTTLSAITDSSGFSFMLRGCMMHKVYIESDVPLKVIVGTINTPSATPQLGFVHSVVNGTPLYDGQIAVDVVDDNSGNALMQSDPRFKFITPDNTNIVEPYTLVKNRVPTAADLKYVGIKFWDVY